MRGRKGTEEEREMMTNPPWMTEAGGNEEDDCSLLEQGFIDDPFMEQQQRPSDETMKRIRSIDEKVGLLYNRLNGYSPWTTCYARCLGMVVCIVMLVVFLYFMEWFGAL